MNDKTWIDIENYRNFGSVFFMKFLPIYHIYFLSGLILMSFPACTHENNSGSDGISSSDIKENIITNPIIVMSNENRTTAKTRSDLLEKDNNDFALLTGNVITDIFDDHGWHSSTLYSDSARINEQSNNFEAFGNVSVISDSGLTLHTKCLNWDNTYKLITSNDSVMFTTKNQDTLYGIGFTSDMDLSHWKILEPTGVSGRNF